ncbi:protein kinase [Chloroflexota bacterium]
MIGRNLGNYRVMEQIGMGGMATVYKAYDPDTDRYVAIKVLPEHFSQDPKFRQRFEREAKAIAKLEHIHILPLFAYGEEDGTAYMAMRYLKAGSLTDRIQAGALPLDEASRLLSQIASALDHAHAHGVLHRDVKPSNVLLDESGNAFLTDFGIAKMVESTLDLTGGGILGTPAYMSPEQCRGNTELTPTSDQYSLGIIVYEMITGRAPFQAETPIALIHMQLSEALPLPRQIRPDLPEDVERVILKALTKEPGLRYSTCGDMAAAFARATAQAPAGMPVVDDLTLAGGATPLTTPAIEDATVLHGPGKQAAVVPKSRPRFPVWLLAVIGVVVFGLIGAAIVAGLTLFGAEEEEAKPVVAEIEGDIEVGIEEPPEAEEAPPPEHEAAEIPEGPRNVRPCDWDGFGSGLCIYVLPQEEPVRKILQDANLEFVGPGAWSPDGEQIAFSAVEQGGDYDGNITIYLINADGTELAELPKIINDTSPAWSPDGEWLAFHSGCNLAIMRPDGSDPTIIWEPPDESWCVEIPQWSPNSQSIAFSLMDTGEREFALPVNREIIVVSDEGETVTSIASITHQNEDCLASDVAFSPDGAEVAYVDDVCQPHLVLADGSGQTEPIDDFPYHWMAMNYPQWEGETFLEEAAYEEEFEEVLSFFDDFEQDFFDQERWAIHGDIDNPDAFLREGQFRIAVENDQPGPWDMNLEALLQIPDVRHIEYIMGLDEAEGRQVGFGVSFFDDKGKPRNILFNADGAVLFEEEGQIIDLREPVPRPVEYHFMLRWEEDRVVVYLDGEPVYDMEGRGLGSLGVVFWVHLESGERIEGFLDEVYLEYAAEAKVSEPSSEPISGEYPEGKFIELCEDAKFSQICVRDIKTDRVTQITDNLEFEEIYVLAWSPDGQQIVFDAGSSYDTTQQYDHKLYLIRADGSELEQITHGDGNDVFPDWSRDGEWITFHRDCGLWVIRTDGSEARELLAGTDKFCTEMMAWSPDGRQIAFLNTPDEEIASREIWVVNDDGTDPQVVYSFEPGWELWGMVAWSPDARQIIYLYYEDDGQEKVLLINADGGGEPELLEEHMIENLEVWLWLPYFWPRWGGR